MGKHKGNERDKINPSSLRLEVGATSSSKKLNPSTCSKLVAVFMQDAKNATVGLARRRRWNIEVKLNITPHIKNIATHSGREVQGLFDNGLISPNNRLETGKFLMLIVNDVSLLVL